MTARNDDDDEAIRQLVRRAYAADPEPRDFDVIEGLRDVLNRAHLTAEESDQHRLRSEAVEAELSRTRSSRPANISDSPAPNPEEPTPETTRLVAHSSGSIAATGRAVCGIAIAPEPEEPSPWWDPHKSAGPRSRTIKVLLAEDLDLLRSALVSLLSEEEDLEVVAALKCNDTMIQTAVRLRPDIIVLDVDGPGTKPVPTIQELRRRLPETQIVVLAAAKPAGLMQRVLAADVLGAVDKNAPAARLLEAIRGVAKGELVVDVNLAVAALAAEPNPLTSRELEILRLAADGASGLEIAERLHLSPSTVRRYLSKVINKTCARTRIDAVRIARDAGWI